MSRPYQLACHCQAIRLEVDADLGEVLDCNCSTCARAGFLHWYVPWKSVKLLTESRPLSTYVWRYLHEGHHFCATCGTGVYRSGYRNEVVSLNARIIVGVDPHTLTVRRYDGRQDMPPGPDSFLGAADG